MKVQCKRSDRISNLPEETIEKILSLMPIRDALRTSILSRKWRYCWTTMPKLVFDDDLLDTSYAIEELEKFKIVNVIFGILLLHRGPLSELSIVITNIDISNEIDLIILHLSRSNNIKKFVFEISECYKLPCAFFSLQGLEHLDLTFCAFEVPLMFNGFRMLKSLRFNKVEITAKKLRRFLTSCPLLQEFTLIRTQFFFYKMCTFVKLFSCLPSVQNLEISRFYIKRFAAGDMPQKLSTLLVNLRILNFAVCFLRQEDILSLLFLISSSPNLEKIIIKMINGVGQTFNNLLDLQDFEGINLDHLKEVEMRSFHTYAPEMEFVKFIIAKSPVLKKAQIRLCKSVSVDEELKMFRVFLQSPSIRASPANFIIERSKYYR